MHNVLTVLLAGGAGERLHPLTRHRAKPAVPFGGIYRIIDFTLSNCINSDCRQIQVLVQYKSNSLARHIRTAWGRYMRGEMGEFIDIIPPQMLVNDSWYLGTADAIYQNLYFIEKADPHEVLIVSGDHIYKMDYQKLMQFHRQVEADLTISAIEFPVEAARGLGILEIEADGRVTGFQEKPAHPKTMPGNPNAVLASMGIYVFNAEVLKRVVREDADRDTIHDFGRDVIPRMIKDFSVYVHVFQDENKKVTKYWRDVGTLDSYWEANMDLIAVDPQFNLYDKEWPLRTHMPNLPPAKFVFADPGERCGIAMDSFVSPGCIISGGQVERCVLSPEVRVNSYARVEDSILLHGVNVGRHSRIRKAIIEKHVQLPDRTVIGYDPEEDAKRYRVTPKGVVVVEANDSHLVRIPEPA